MRARHHRPPSATGLDPVPAQLLVRKLLGVGIDGSLGFESAQQVALDAMKHHGSTEAAVAAVVGAHRRLIAVGGFVTGVGGFVTLPAALPANVVEFYLITTRMVAAVAHIRGHDLRDPSLRTAILLTLVDSDPEALMRRVGIGQLPVGGHLAGLGAGRLPAPARMMLNKAIGFRLISQFGQRALTGFGRGLPVAGGVIGAGLDVYLFSRIASSARREFPPRF